MEPIGHEMTVISFGEGRQIGTMGAAGAQDRLRERKLGRLEIMADGKSTVHRQNVITHIRPGQRARNVNPGGGGYGLPWQRPLDEVCDDVKNGLVSAEAAQLEYGVVLKSDLSVDREASERCRCEMNRQGDKA
nr:hypothetical protein [Aquitalea magnusonii]